jgi:hypothetical protein
LALRVIIRGHVAPAGIAVEIRLPEYRKGASPVLGGMPYATLANSTRSQAAPALFLVSVARAG